jgi:hypothetical protein
MSLYRRFLTGNAVLETFVVLVLGTDVSYPWCRSEIKGSAVLGTVTADAEVLLVELGRGIEMS